MGITERLHDIVAPRCDDLGVELVDLEYAGGLVRVTIDRAGGVDIDTLAAVTRAVSRALDADDPIAGRYTLEVSSPGLERPLRTAAQFARAIGSPVRIKTRPGVEGDRRIDGVLAAADDHGVLVRLGAPGGGERHVRYDDIERARTVFEWGPAPKPGSSRKGAKPASARADKKAVNA
jgi:ribosome maturation factor RimP